MMAEFFDMEAPCMEKKQAPQTRPSLLIRLRTPDDTEAWNQFIDLYAPLLYGFFRRRGLQDADAADVTQEALQGCASSLPNFDYDKQQGSFRSWLYAIARNKLADYLAKRERQQSGRGDTASFDLLNTVASPDDDLQRWEQEYRQRMFAWAAEQVRERVQESTWQAFWRTSIDGVSGAAVADELGMSVGAVYVAKSRVVAQIKSKVEEIQGELP